MVLLARLACLFSPMSQCEASPGKCQQYFNNVSLQARAAGQLKSLFYCRLQALTATSLSPIETRILSSRN